MDAKKETGAFDEKHVNEGLPYGDPEDRESVATGNVLHRDLKGRHMQMIAM